MFLINVCKSPNWRWLPEVIYMKVLSTVSLHCSTNRYDENAQSHQEKVVILIWLQILVTNLQGNV